MSCRKAACREVTQSDSCLNKIALLLYKLCVEKVGAGNPAGVTSSLGKEGEFNRRKELLATQCHVVPADAFRAGEVGKQRLRLIQWAEG